MMSEVEPPLLATLPGCWAFGRPFPGVFVILPLRPASGEIGLLVAGGVYDGKQAGGQGWGGRGCEVAVKSSRRDAETQRFLGAPLWSVSPPELPRGEPGGRNEA